MSRTMTPLPSTTLCGQRITPFGAVETPGLLEAIDGNSIIYRVDLLSSLQSLWGEGILRCRNQLYKLVSGTCSDTELRQYLKFFYLRNPSFSNFVTREYYFGNQNLPLLRRIIEPARERINRYYEELAGKNFDIIGLDADYLYLQVDTDVAPDIKGVAKVC